MAGVTLTVNGKKVTVDTDEDTPLLWVLRDNLGLTATKFGCGIAQCGACTVLQDGVAIKACVTPVVSVSDKKIVTLEGLPAAQKKALQSAWVAEEVPQCGYCQIGMIMATAGLLNEKPNPTDAEIDEELSHNICRCGTYSRIRRAIHRAAKSLASSKPAKRV
jgi:isoquinoline 1-oxidoreductase alpha subunit